MKKYADKKITVLPAQAGMRVDAFLSSVFDSRSQAEKAIKGSLVYRLLINPLNLADSEKGTTVTDSRAYEKNLQDKGYNKVTKPSYKVQAGESYYIIGSAEVFHLKSMGKKRCHNLSHAKLAQTGTKKPIAFNWPVYNVPVPILFEDKHLLVINKPAGLPVHPSTGHENNTLINALIHKTTLSSGSDPLRPGLVHRLDKDVSGLMILSKNKKTEQLLIEQFKSKKVYRIYRVLTVGKQPTFNHKGQKAQLIFSKLDPSLKTLPSTPANTFSIVGFIGRHPKNRKKFYSFKNEVAGSKKAITHCRVLQSFQDKIHHIECRLETGRTHQIRVHLKSQGLPILKDPIYASPRQQNQLISGLAGSANTKISALSQLALYSAELKLYHPIDNRLLHFHLPWPKEFHPLLNQMSFEKG